jgi:hypothetical protein
MILCKSKSEDAKKNLSEDLWKKKGVETLYDFFVPVVDADLKEMTAVVIGEMHKLRTVCFFFFFFFCI